MKVEICSNDNGSGMITTLNVFKCYNPQQNLFETKPFCKIEEDDFFELLSEKEFEKAEQGKTVFNVSLSKIEEKAEVIYPKY